jgi:hypothetical protein
MIPERVSNNKKDLQVRLLVHNNLSPFVELAIKWYIISYFRLHRDWEAIQRDLLLRQKGPSSLNQ